MSLNSSVLEPEPRGSALKLPASGDYAFDPMDCSATLVPQGAAASIPEALTEQALAHSELGETTLAQSVAYLFVMSIAQRVIGLVRGLLVCIWLTPALLGPWDLNKKFFFLASPLLVLGIPGSLGRYLEYYRQHGALRSVLRRYAGGDGNAFDARNRCDARLQLANEPADRVVVAIVTVQQVEAEGDQVIRRKAEV